MGALAELTQDNFETTIASGVTLVDFWAPWCGPCKSLGPILEEAAGELGDKAKIVKVNTDENIALAQKYGVSSIPFMVVFKDGEPVDQTVGVQPKANIVAMIEKQL
jgi:thioredoxin 1